MGWTTDAKMNCAAARLAATAAALSLLLSPAQGLAASCESDGDCSDGASCDAGECVDEAEAAEDETTAATDDEATSDETDGAAEASNDVDEADSADGTNPKLIGAGIGLAGVGLFGVGVGIAALVGGAGTSSEYVSPGTQAPTATPPLFADKNEAGLQIAGGIMLGLGGAMLIAGAILIPVGATSGPAEDEEAVIVEPLLGPTFGGMRVRF